MGYSCPFPDSSCILIPIIHLKWLEVAKSEADKTIKWRKEYDINHLEVQDVPKWDIWEKSWPTGVCG